MPRKSSFLPLRFPKDVDERERSSSSDDEEDSQQPYDDETVAESSDDDAPNRTTKHASHQPPIPTPKADQKRNEESDSDSDTEGSPADYVVQPIAKVPPSSSKRSRPETAKDSASKIRKKLKAEEKKSGSAPAPVVGHSEGGLSGAIMRVWSEEDEIATLEGMVEFKASKGVDPNADMWAFHSFIKGKLKAEFSKDQLRRKIGRMKKRFMNIANKKGTDPVFSKPHEGMAFEISKKIWGKATEDVEMIKGDEKNEEKYESEEEKEEENGEKGDFWAKHIYIGDFLDNMKLNFPTLSCGLRGMRFFREKLSSIGKVKAKEMEEKCKQLAIERIELDYKMLEVMNEHVQFALDR